jgi:peptide/nickel transport system substrate-binding protein
VIMVPVAAQDDEGDGFGVGVIPIDDNTPGPGEGGVIFVSSTGDPIGFNPLVSGDAESSDAWGNMYPALFTIDWNTGDFAPNLPGGLATGWEFNETGDQVSIFLREDAFWSDGVQITAADFLWSANAIQSGEINSPRSSMFATLADGTPAGGSIVSIEAPDDFTVVVTFDAPNCRAFGDINDATPVPAHIWEELYGDDLASMEEEVRRIPEVTFGPFFDPEYEPESRISLLPYEGYIDAYAGDVIPSEYVDLNVPSVELTVERFLAGELTILGVPSVRQEEFRNDPDFAQYQLFEFTGNGFSFFALNHANPDNPQPAFDEDGNPVEQEPHPVLGDVRVRQAITQAVDIQGIIENVRDNSGIQVSTHTIPTSWVYNPELLYEFSPENAGALLEEAGWVDDDGDPETPRVCQGCLYSEEGTTLSIRITISEGSEQTAQTGEVVAAGLTDIGFDVNLEAVDFGSALVPDLLGQTFDMSILAWNLGLPVDPDGSFAYAPEADNPGGGFNFGSYNFSEYNALMEQAADPTQTNGCDPEVRRDLYLQSQQILFEQVPYVYLWVSESLTAVQPELINWNPTAYSRTYSLDAWSIEASE